MLNRISSESRHSHPGPPCPHPFPEPPPPNRKLPEGCCATTAKSSSPRSRSRRRPTSYEALRTLSLSWKLMAILFHKSGRKNRFADYITRRPAGPAGAGGLLASTKSGPRRQNAHRRDTGPLEVDGRPVRQI